MENYNLNNIARYRAERGMSQTELANALNVSRQALFNWERGKRVPRKNMLEKISDVLKVPVNKLGTFEVATNLDKIKYTGKIRVYGAVRAGFPNHAEQDIDGYIWTTINNPDTLFALRVNGDSMNRACLPNGSYAIVRKQSIVDDGDIAVVLIDDDEATIKYFYHTGSMVILKPCSTDPTFHDMTFNLLETNITILGKVVGYQGEF